MQLECALREVVVPLLWGPTQPLTRCTNYRMLSTIKTGSCEPPRLKPWVSVAMSIGFPSCNHFSRTQNRQFDSWQQLPSFVCPQVLGHRLRRQHFPQPRKFAPQSIRRPRNLPQ
jgi:hypothetical protein